MNVINKVDWTIRAERSALLIHDMQPHYCESLDETVRTDLADQISRLARLCAARAMPIFVSQVPPARLDCERGLMRDMWGRGPSDGVSAENAGRMANAPALDPALDLHGLSLIPVTKRSYSAFYGNDFEVMLRRLGRDNVIITGIYTSIGCLSTAMDAFMRDIRPFMVADALADFSEAEHEAGLKKAAQTCARIVDTTEAVEHLQTRRTQRPSTWAFDVC
ncbi:bifunctional isochorismate lyase/aryl carrier protein [Rhodopseudomonas julia]|uniref:Bifunctional isochorismate lyase/aryl carrier protein n=1 Tax=Rhodopseudomonas julia TaxID=200617 RepID=A0ABU0C2I0_9BRAD|nr:isochorismatase family protein [Rhodopseudomonas julia]MDQ0324721.1 bifunctional isochorismate lyase/aryl carrier protein [Rhodopseudomonas julia]